MNAVKSTNKIEESSVLQPVSVRYRVNVFHGGRERWKYCRTIERAKYLQETAKKGGLCSIIYQKTTKGYVVCCL